MITRIAAGVTGLAVLVPAVLWGGQLAVELIVPPFLLICLWEYASMAFPKDRIHAMTWLVLTTGSVYGAALYLPERWVYATVPVVALATMVFVVLRPGDRLDQAAGAIGRYLVGTIWIGSLAFLPLLRRLDSGIAWIFVVLAIAWLSDTGGYFAGRAFGRHKLYARVSPKKTWEGFVGGLVFATVGVVVIKLVALPEVSIPECLALGVVVGSMGVLGDLTESLLKRAYKVKDSGSILPGHGGILDRIDAMLFVAPMIFVHAVLIRGV